MLWDAKLKFPSEIPASNNVIYLGSKLRPNMRRN